MDASGRFCKSRNDVQLQVDVAFQRTVDVDELHDNTVVAKVTFLKADDYKPMRYQKPKLGFGLDFDKETNMKSSLEFSVPMPGTLSAEKVMAEKVVSPEKAPRDDVNSRAPMPVNRAIRWELPSGEFYAVRHLDSTASGDARRKRSRPLKVSPEVSTVHTAREIATREKGDRPDPTDRDAESLRDVKSLQDVVSQQESIESQKSDSPRASSRSRSPGIQSPEAQSSPTALHKQTQTASERKPFSGSFQVLKIENGIVTANISTT